MILATDEMQARFSAAKHEFYTEGRERDSIGVLSEKTVHAVVKRYLEPDGDLQEVKVGKFYADIFRADGIVEIQTRNFGKLREKLAAFLPEYPVTVVYPIAERKWVRWVDKESGALSERHKSPRRGTPYDVFYELYKIRPWITHGHFRLKLLMMEMEELRYLDGWSKNKKRGSTRMDRIPGELIAEYDFTRPEDYMELVPLELTEPFSVKEFSQAARVDASVGGQVIPLLKDLGIVERVGKDGKKYIYRVKEL
ncbi:MAG: hypothetical protein LUE29_07335 [Lachnospiraceae bacterium]|nr:hypothetical protein [Lachnospiraceae bacterium]